MDNSQRIPNPGVARSSRAGGANKLRSFSAIKHRATRFDSHGPQIRVWQQIAGSRFYAMVLEGEAASRRTFQPCC
jgi:hypothetical protein